MNNWLFQNHCLIPDIPFSCANKISSEKAEELISKNKAFLIRNIYNFDTKEKKNGWFIVKDKFLGMEELSSSTRSKIRRGLKKCEVRLSDSSINGDVRTDNWEVFLKKDNEKIGFSTNRIAQGEVFYETFRISKEFLRGNYPYYALIYSMNEYYLSGNEYKFVCDGFRTMRERSNIQNFLIDKFKFRKAFCSTRLFYNHSIRKIIKYFYAFRLLIPGENARALFLQHKLFHKNTD